MYGFVYGAAAALNSLLGSPDPAVMNEISAGYSDTLKPDTELLHFYRMSDDAGHNGVVTEITYRDTAEWDDGRIYLETEKDIRDASGLKGVVPALRRAILEDVENPDGTHTARVLYFFRKGYPRYSYPDKKCLDSFSKDLQVLPLSK